MRVDTNLMFWGIIFMLSVFVSSYFLHHVSSVDWHPYVLVDREVVSDLAQFSYVLGLLTGLYTFGFLHFLTVELKRRGVL